MWISFLYKTIEAFYFVAAGRMTGILLLLYFTSECEDSEIKVLEALVIGQDGKDAGVGSWGRPERTYQTSWRFGPGLGGCTLLPHKERTDKYYVCWDSL